MKGTQPHYTKEEAIEITDSECLLGQEIGKRLYGPCYAEIFTWKAVVDSGLSKTQIQKALIGLLRKGLLVRQGAHFSPTYKLGKAIFCHQAK